MYAGLFSKNRASGQYRYYIVLVRVENFPVNPSEASVRRTARAPHVFAKYTIGRVGVGILYNIGASAKTYALWERVRKRLRAFISI